MREEIREFVLQILREGMGIRDTEGINVQLWREELRVQEQKSLSAAILQAVHMFMHTVCAGIHWVQKPG